jgi:hypothetical protein
MFKLSILFFIECFIDAIDYTFYFFIRYSSATGGFRSMCCQFASFFGLILSLLIVEIADLADHLQKNGSSLFTMDKLLFPF